MKNAFLTFLLSASYASIAFAQTPDTFYVNISTGTDAAGRGTSISDPARTVSYTVNELVDGVLTNPAVVKIAPGTYDGVPSYDDSYYANPSRAPWFDIDTIITDSINTLSIEALDFDNPPYLITENDSTRGALLRMVNNYTTLRAIHFRGSGDGSSGYYNTGGLRMSGHHITIRNCTFSTAQRSHDHTRRNISIGGHHITIANNVFYYAQIYTLMLEFGAGADHDIDVLNNVFAMPEGHRTSGPNSFGNCAIGLYCTTPNTVVSNMRIWNNIFSGNGTVVQLNSGLEANIDFPEHLWSYNIYDDFTTLQSTNLEGEFVMDTAVNSIVVNPYFMDTLDLDNGYMDSLDFHIRKHSRVIDGGSPQILDPDGGRSDMGIYGGPYAHDVQAPNRVDLAYVDHVSTTDNLGWDYASPPSDFDFYGIYRSTDPYFAPVPSNLLDSISNVSTHTLSPGDGGVFYYYKVNVWDDDTLGGGYRMYDTIPPAVTSLVYESKGTTDPSDDTLFITFSERIVDPFVYPVPADLYFDLTGAGSLTGAVVTTGARLNDEQVIITGFGFDGVLCHGRSRIAFDDPADFLDYAENENIQSASFGIDIYNVYNASSGRSDTTLTAALANAAAGDVIGIMDNGLYRERVTVALDNVTIGSDTARAAVIDGSNGGTVMTVTGDNVTVDGLKFTGASSGNTAVLVHGTSSGTIVRNCIAFGNVGSGFSFAGTGTLLHSVAYDNGQNGVFFNGSGNCGNTISASNTGANFYLNASTTESDNCSYGPGASDQNYGSWVFNPRFASTADQWAVDYLSLQSSSPCINMASAGTAADINGLARPYAGAADIGTYEVPYNPLALASYTVTAAPSDTLAGDYITITVTATDQFGNRFYTYNNDFAFSTVGADAPARLSFTGSGVTDAGNGTGTVSAGRFDYGVYSFNVTYELSGDAVQIQIDDSDYGVTGTGPSITWVPAAINYIRVEPGASGQQTDQPVTGVVPTTSGLSMHASMYDQYGNYRGDTTVAWSQIPGGTLVPATGYEFPGSPAVSYEFRPDPTSEGTSGRIIATLGAFADTSDLISIIAAPGAVRILTDADGDKATEVDTLSMLDIDTLVLYAAAYDSADQYIGNLVGDWTSVEVADSFQTVSVNSSNITFIPVEEGRGYFRFVSGTLADSTGLVSVLRSVKDAVRITMELVDGSDDSTVNTGTDFSLRITAWDEDSLVAFSFDSTVQVTWSWGSVTDTVNEELGTEAVKPADGALPFDDGYATASGFRLVEAGVAVITVRIPGYGALSATVRINARDGNAPFMMADLSHTRDTDGDGRLDRFEVVFNEPFDASLATAAPVSGTGGFTVDGANDFTVVGYEVVPETLIGTESRALVVLHCSNSGVGQEDVENGMQEGTDTDNQPLISYSNATGSLIDVRGNPAQSDPIMPRDGAGPVVIHAQYFEPNEQYGIPDGDYLIVTFSEKVVDSLAGAGADTVFGVIGLGRLGTDALVVSRVSDDKYRINMGTAVNGAVEPSPVADSLYIITRKLEDQAVTANPAPANNRPVAIHLANSANLVSAVYVAPCPVTVGSSTPSTFITVGEVNGYRNDLEQTGGGIIRYRLNTTAESVILSIYTLTGRIVVRERISSGEPGAAAGDNYYYWNGRNARGRIIETGAYLLEVDAESTNRGQVVREKIGVVK